MHPAARAGLVRALGVLHGWDRRRSRAWARADAASLRALYVPDSPAAAADAGLLASYTARSLVVRRLVTQVFAVRVQQSSGRRIVVRVLDRVAGGEVAGPAGTRRLRSSPPVCRTVTFRRDRGAWRVARVSDSGAAPRAGPLPRRGR